MPKSTTAERLSQAIANIKTRLEEYLKKIASSNMRNGFCVIVPTHRGALPPTQAQMEAIKAGVLEEFKTENLFGLAMQYSLPPEGILPSSKPEGSSDYEIRGGIAEFDEAWQVDQFAKGLLYCPAETEFGVWHPRYNKLSDALRLTPLVDMAMKDMRARSIVKSFLEYDAKAFFDIFIVKYVKDDPNIPPLDREKDIECLYGDVLQFLVAEAPIFHAYAQAQALKKKTRNEKTKALMTAFIRSVEDHCIQFIDQVGASSATQNAILAELRQDFRKGKQSYDAERPAQSLYYFRTAQLLLLFILEFLSDPGKHLASGEIAMFIWLSQHMSFEGPPGIQINDFLHMQVTDFDHKKNTLLIRGKRVLLTKGLGELLSAWLGDASRVNRRWLFTKLKHEFLKDNLVRMSAQLPSFEGDILAKDLLLRPHGISDDVPVDRQFRQDLEWQSNFVSQSPYTDTINLAKQIREKVDAMLSKSKH